jgi:hypothetical protein
MGDLADFLAARIYDDEQLAREMPAPASWGIDPAPDGGAYIVDAAGGLQQDDLGEMRDLRHGLFVSRVLLECEAKRGILLDYMTRRRRVLAINGRTEDDPALSSYPLPSDLPLRYLALPYRAHPEYSAAWAPPTPGTVETWGRR